MCRFYLFTSKSGKYYAQIMDPQTGTVVVTRSTRTKNRDEAAIIAGEWLIRGLHEAIEKLNEQLVKENRANCTYGSYLPVSHHHATLNIRR